MSTFWWFRWWREGETYEEAALVTPPKKQNEADPWLEHFTGVDGELLLFFQHRSIPLANFFCSFSKEVCILVPAGACTKKFTPIRRDMPKWHHILERDTKKQGFWWFFDDDKDAKRTVFWMQFFAEPLFGIDIRNMTRKTKVFGGSFCWWQGRPEDYFLNALFAGALLA